jgi:hypothetical protein
MNHSWTVTYGWRVGELTATLGDLRGVEVPETLHGPTFAGYPHWVKFGVAFG